MMLPIVVELVKQLTKNDKIYQNEFRSNKVSGLRSYIFASK
jgi:hypothetical protein